MCIRDRIPIAKEDRIVVLGDGKLAQLCAQVLWSYSKRLVCVGKHAWKLNLLNNLHINTANIDDPIERGVDIVVEATGSEAGLRRAMELVRPEGVVVLKTTVAHPTPLDLSVPVINEIKIIGSRCGPFRPALEALAMGTVEVRPMITGIFELRDAAEALRRATDSDAMKVLLHI